MEFDPCFVGDKVEPIIITLTNNGSHTVEVSYRGGFESDDSMVSVSANHSYTYEMAPGESREYAVTLKTREAASGTATIEANLLLDGYDWAGMVGDGFGVGRGGISLNISDILTVDYEVKPLSAASQGDIDWDVSADVLDFDAENFPYRETASGDRVNPFYEYRYQELAVTNRGSLPFILRAEVDASACQHPDAPITFGTMRDPVRAKPGETFLLPVTAKECPHTEGPVQSVLKLTAYYPDSEEKNPITADIPLSIKYLYDGGYRIYNRSDNSHGTIKTSGGISRDPYSGNILLLAREGSSVTFVMTPYDPTAYHVSDIKLNGESVGISG